MLIDELFTACWLVHPWLRTAAGQPYMAPSPAPAARCCVAVVSPAWSCVCGALVVYMYLSSMLLRLTVTLPVQQLLLPTLTRGSVVLRPSMRTFGNALKSFPVAARHEQLLFNFSSAPVNPAPHVITEQWYSLFGGEHPYDPNIDARIRIYIDDEVSPSLDFQLFFAHTVGVQNCVDDVCSDPRVPWSSQEVQHMAHAGALKNRYRIPFTHSIRITATLPSAGIIYYYCRGMTHLPVTVGDLQLPDNARLRLHKNWNVSLAPLAQLDLVPPRRNSSGLLYATIWSAESEFIGFMEGCVRATPDAQPTIFLSSGTEDYFESANFFNAGHPVDATPGAFPWPNKTMQDRNNVFTSAGAASAPESGVGYLHGTNPTNYSMSAYKFHISDPIVSIPHSLSIPKNTDFTRL
jgi:hypothetical protein